MGELSPLLRGGASDVERLLLASAADDGPPDARSRDQTLAALGVTPWVASGSATAGSASIGSATATIAKLLASSVARWVAVGGLAAVATFGATQLVRRPDPGAAREARPPMPVASLRAASGASPPAAATRLREIDVAGGRVLEERRAAPAPPWAPRELTTRTEPSRHAIAVARPPASAGAGSGDLSRQGLDGADDRTSTGSRAATLTPKTLADEPRGCSSLREEAAMLEGARESLAASATGDAWAALDQFDARCKGGALAEEATVLRVQVLLARGDRTNAATVAQDFAERHPASPYVARVRALVAPGP